MAIKLEVFSTSSCPHCPGAIEAAERMKAKYGDEIDLDLVKIDENEENYKRAIEYGIMAVPNFVINGEVLQPGALPDDYLIEKLESLM